MANNYSQFSEGIEDLSVQERVWLEMVLRLDWEDEEESKKIREELSLKDNADLEYWPHFEWQIEADLSLWLYSVEGFSEEHLIWLVQAFLKKFRPGAVFRVTGAETCSKPRAGEFGGWWLAIGESEYIGGNTWDAAKEAEEKIRSKSSSTIP